MTFAILTTLGGIGLFMLGMSLMTDGLRALTGGVLRRVLKRATRNPLTGALTGTISTAILQSSSATTVAAVGFVGAGLLTFPQALGIIFGANVGTTVTGWMVALLGFKLNLGTLAMPLVLMGVLIRFISRGKGQSVGLAIAGFSLLFFGIEAMQEGMSGLREVLNPSVLPEDTFFGRLQLLFLGILITIVTQSSSAGVATALAALGIGAISFPQAAAMVIGMDVGTTFTAALATVGGSVASRRTGYAHVILNIMTGVMAFALLTPLGMLIQTGRLPFLNDPQIALVSFHTTFNLLGLILILGVTRQFARLVIRLVPDRGESLTEDLDNRHLAHAEAALDTATGSLLRIGRALSANLRVGLSETDTSKPKSLDEIDQALQEVRDFSSRIPSVTGENLFGQRRASVFHMIDHMSRLSRRARQSDRMRTIRADATLATFADAVEDFLQDNRWLDDNSEEPPSFEVVHNELDVELNRYREALLSASDTTTLDLEAALKRLDAIRWLERITDHIWRITVHLSFVRAPAKEAVADLPVEPGEAAVTDAAG